MSDKKELNTTENGEPKRQLPVVAPLVDIYEGDDELVLVADVPGAASDSLSLNFEKSRLDIEARAPFERAESSALLREYDGVDFRRSFEVVSDIDAEHITAELSNGVLTIHLPKSEKNKPRQIPITVN